MYKNTDNIREVIKSQRIRWMGHVIRMTENKLPRKVLLETRLGPNRRKSGARPEWRKRGE